MPTSTPPERLAAGSASRILPQLMSRLLAVSRVRVLAGLCRGAGRCLSLLLAALSACRSPAEDACVQQFASAQNVVMQVASEDLASVTGSVAAVEEARGTCLAAGRNAEAEELAKALAQLTTHRDRMLRRAEMLAQRTQLSPEELARIVDAGDPKCPRGQGYLHEKSGKRIVCVGPQPVDMSRAQAEEYFKGRGYKQLPGGTPQELRFEYGAELLVLTYADTSGSSAPSCVTVYPPPDRSWQEATARLTGVAPARLKANQPIRRAGGPLAFALDESPQKVVARLGSCGS
jgi:hypothetical protein